MNRLVRIKVALGILTVSLLSLGLFTSCQAAPHGGGGGGGGGRGFGGGAGGRGFGGSAGGGHNFGGGGAIHAPSGGGGFRGQSPSFNHSPAFSTPRSGNFNGGGTRPFSQPGNHPQLAPGNIRPGLTQPGLGHPGLGNTRGNHLPRNNGGVGNGVNFGVGHQNNVNRPNVNLVNQSLGGNSIHIGQHNFSLGNHGYRPAYANHSFYHGYWNGHYGHGWGYPGGFGYGGFGGYGGYGGNRYYRPLGWGLGAWGLGALAYNSGYLGYYNPYYVQSAGYNYAQPVVVSYAAPVSTTQDQGLDAAMAAFQQNDYDKALDLVNRGISQTPSDAVMHEFRALVLFAKGDYQQAAGTIHSVLAVGPGWNWTTLSSLYPDVAIYTAQLRALESNVRSQPQDSASRFLLAYHYMTGGHNDAAARQLQQVTMIMPNDRVAADLLKMISPIKTDQPTDAPPQPTTTSSPTAPPVDPAMLIGNWAASREDGQQFALTLTNDSTFSWKFTVKDQKPQELKGKYTLAGNVLALEGSDGGSLIANLTTGTGTAFNFKLLGAPTEDPGLNFRRE